MTKEKIIDLGVEPIESLLDRPVDELAVFIGGDQYVLETLVNEVDNLKISEEEKNKKLENIYKAAHASGVKFPTVEEKKADIDELEDK